MKYCKKHFIVDAVQWWKHGDHPKVSPFDDPDNRDGQGIHCSCCGTSYRGHGMLQGNLICPGRYIVVDKFDNVTSCSPGAFVRDFEMVEDQAEEAKS